VTFSHREHTHVGSAGVRPVGAVSGGVVSRSGGGPAVTDVVARACESRSCASFTSGNTPNRADRPSGASQAGLRARRAAASALAEETGQVTGEAKGE
jgi:hypothetical protein